MDKKLPRHVAIVMDGNGRWAKARGLPRVAGHKKGADSVRSVVEFACESGVEFLTLFGFSSENWNRPQDEVSTLMELLRFYLANEVLKLNKQGVRLRFIGNREKLPSDVVKKIIEAEDFTKQNSRLNLIIALSYGGREEIIFAVKKIINDVKHEVLSEADINEEEFAKRLFTKDIPDPDLLIRTSGEVRISNFLLWQLAYSEFVFIKTLWPDFSKKDFDDALEEYAKRDRRYGKI